MTRPWICMACGKPATLVPTVKMDASGNERTVDLCACTCHADQQQG